MSDDDQIHRLAGDDLQGDDGRSFSLLEVASAGRKLYGWFEAGDASWAARLLSSPDVVHAGAPLEHVRDQTRQAYERLLARQKVAGELPAGARNEEARTARKRAIARLEADLAMLTADHLGARDAHDPAAGPSAVYRCSCCGRQVDADALDDAVLARLERALLAGNLDAPLKAAGIDHDEAVDLFEGGHVQALLEATVVSVDAYHDLDAPRIIWRSVARNAPCPCGSGSKFKLCCGAGS